MDKDRAHKLVSLAGIGVPKSVVFRRFNKHQALKEIEEKLSYPLFIKPVCAGSSFGITKVKEKRDLDDAIEIAFQHDTEVIAEEEIKGFEVGCAVLGIDELTVGRVDEIELSGGFFDYTEKYTLKSSKIHMPARIEPEAEKRIQEAAATIYKALGCSGFARVDMFYTPAGEIIFNEVNTIPGFTDHSRYPNMMKGIGLSFPQTLIDYEYAVSLNKQGYDVKTHIKVDTGMHRLGFDYSDQEKIAAVFAMKHLHITGIYTHLCAADSLEKQDVSFTNRQIKRFYNLIKSLQDKGIDIPKIHIQSSYGLMNYPELKSDYVRAGISLYGVYSSPNDQTKLRLDLKPVLSLKSRIVLLREIRKGESLGYSRAFIADRDSLIAMLPVGYADGYPRNLSCGKGYVLVNGYRAPIVGKICMDQMAVDVTDVPNVKTGTSVTLIGKDGEDEISAAVLAELSGSITNELLSRIGQRLKVVPTAHRPTAPDKT